MSVTTLQRKDFMNETSQFIHVFSELPEKLMANLNAQRREATMCDVTIITNDGRSHRAHKAILAASSHYLESELASLNDGKLNDKSETVIQLGMVSSQSFETLLDLLYTSKLVLTSENVAQVLLAAEVLDLEEVSAFCRQFLRSRITSKSVTCTANRHDSEDDAFRDTNNNIIISDSQKSELQRPESFKRGRSEESVASSSGVSSISSNSFRRVSDTAASCEVKFDESTPNEIFERPVSLSELPAQDETGRDFQRPLSAPHTCVDDAEGCSNSTSVESEEPPAGSLEVDLLGCSDKAQRNSNSPTELVDVTSTMDISFDTSGSSNVSDDNGKPKGESNEVMDDDERSVYRIKTETHFAPENSGQYEYSEDFSKNFPSGDHGCCGYKSEDRTSETPLNLAPGDRIGVYPAPPVPYYALPESHRRSFDSVFEQPTASFVNLNSTPAPARKKAKSVDHPPEGLPPYSPLPNMFTGQLGTPPSLWASLYMLRSQALNYATNNLYPTKDLTEPGPTSEMPDFSRRQLQHSKSVVTTGALFCKLCRLEFTSDWALSMHYHLCHPMSYFYHKPPHGQSDFSQLPTHFGSGSDNIGSKVDGDLLPRPLPLMKSVSSPAKSESAQNPGDTEVAKDFQAKILGFFGPSEPKTTHRCYHCKKEFDSIFLLRKHKTVEHMKRPFRCHRCDSAFPNKAGLSVHLRSHTGERPYRCKICNKAFTQLGHVQRHQKVHTGEKPYQCPLCQTRVRDKASMHYHILAHQGVKPFQCDQCDARFTKRSSLVKHKNVHTGSFLYQCPQCKASFREKASLSRHVRSQHKDPCFTTATEKNSASLDLTRHGSAVVRNLGMLASASDEMKVA